MLGAVEIIGITLAAAVVASSAQYIFKRNVRQFEFDTKEIIIILTHPKTLLGLLMYIASLVIYLYALNNTPVISLVYPIFASTFVFILLISKFALNERINLHRVLGMAMIMIGIAVISLTFPV